MTPEPVVHTFTPDEARAIYDATVAAGYNFRKTATSVIQEYGEAMRTGSWRWTEANPIRLSTDGTLCSDGMHRLLSCAQSGVPLQSLVLYGDEWRSGIHTDRGTRRTLAQFVKHEHISSAVQKCAVVTGHLCRVEAKRRNITLNYARLVHVQDEQVIKFIVEHDAALDSAINTSGSAHDRGFNRTGYGVFMFQARSIDVAMATDMHADLLDAQSDPADAITLLRRFGLHRYDRTSRRLGQTATIDNFVKAWNHRLNGDALKVWKPAIWTDIRFPIGYDDEEAS